MTVWLIFSLVSMEKNGLLVTFLPVTIIVKANRGLERFCFLFFTLRRCLFAVWIGNDRAVLVAIHFLSSFINVCGCFIGDDYTMIR